MGLFNRTKTPAESTPAACPGMPQPGPGISLTKGAAATISLTKGDSDITVTAHLDWDGGTASRRAQGADLELYVLYVPASEVTGPGRPKHGGHAVYWNALGDTVAYPFIQHHGDSTVPGRETATIARPDQQGYALICAYSAVGNGIGSFRSYGARAVVTDGRGQTVTVPLYDDNRLSYWVAIALVDFTVPGAVSIRQVERYSARHCEARPVLYSDGSFEMDRGPVEFKR